MKQKLNIILATGIDYLSRDKFVNNYINENSDTIEFSPEDGSSKEEWDNIFKGVSEALSFGNPVVINTFVEDPIISRKIKYIIEENKDYEINFESINFTADINDMIKATLAGNSTMSSNTLIKIFNNYKRI